MPNILPPQMVPPLDRDASTVIELRQYILRPGKLDRFITLFEREFIETQEAAGARVLGHFRDARDPDRFVWLRGFRDMSSRAQALTTFYGSPLWKTCRDEANAALLDTDNVLLLRPVDRDSAFRLPRERPAIGAVRRATALIVATIYLLQAPVDDEFIRFFAKRVNPVMVETGAAPTARFRSEYAENNFPRLPVRSGEHAFVWFASFPGLAAYESHRKRLESSKQWREDVAPELARWLKSPFQELLLDPGARSLLGEADRNFSKEASMTYTTERSGDLHDFDFIAGDWKAANRRLKQRGVGSDDWDEFPSTTHATLHMDGVVNVDEITFPTKGWSGVTVRIFDKEKRQWSIYWINSRMGVLTPPQVGGFSGERGEFYGEDEDDGKPVKVRYLWIRQGADAARWEQAFSSDGQTWETNWTMDFTRVAK